ncbi:MAG TPA: hypothetical protein VJ608_06295 [Albitalea sp.]|nr:hypothetical protein [Albitalea sp.]
MTQRKTPPGGKAPALPGGPALGRARQFALSRGLPPPQVEGVAAPPPPPAAKKPRKKAPR